MSPEEDGVLCSIQREAKEQSTHHGTCVHGNAASSGKSKWGYGKLLRNKSVGMWFWVRLEGL